MIDPSVLVLALIVGGANWAFRVLPILLGRRASAVTGWRARFLAATGPAAIATLFVASVLPGVQSGPLVPLAAGVAAVAGVFGLTRSAVGATLAGAAAFGAAVAVLGA